MPSSLRAATVVLSIDLELDLHQRARGDARRFESTVNALLTLCESYRLPATWGVADPAFSAATEALLAAPPGHELAVLADHAWSGPQAGRRRFARELARRLAAARQAGLDVATLLQRDVSLDGHLDLAAKLGVRVVRNPLLPVAPAPAPRPPTGVRHGVRWLDADVVLPARGRWWQAGLSEFALERRLDALSHSGRLLHLAIDAPRLCQADDCAMEAVRRALSHLAQLRDAGGLTVETLGGVTRRLEARPAVRPLRSILHPPALQGAA